eukprot:TRINITY_DN2073_c0_g1_i1.p2 TRINITY_DN2073_c0_g1~~TRINITY_DN2073_c0_g1_i1.p2  ORF type:complete len:253 (-),score=25.77 TRINITY_DN2073_c0_g1_i1:130-888(-)
MSEAKEQLNNNGSGPGSSSSSSSSSASSGLARGLSMEEKFELFTTQIYSTVRDAASHAQSSNSNKRKLTTAGKQQMAVAEAFEVLIKSGIDPTPGTQAINEFIAAMDDDGDLDDALKDLERRVKKAFTASIAEEVVSVLKKANKKTKTADSWRKLCVGCGKIGHTLDTCWLAARSRTTQAMPNSSTSSVPQITQTTTPQLSISSDMLSQLLSGRESRPTKRCEHCHKSGHVADDCWTLHPEKKPARLNMAKP